MTGNINKPLLLHLVGCIYYLYHWCTVKQISENEIYLLIKYIKSVLWRVAKCLSYLEEVRCLKVKKEIISKRAVRLERITPKYMYIYTSMYARANNATTNELIEKITFVLPYSTVLWHKPITVKALELRHVSTLCGSSSGNVHKYY